VCLSGPAAITHHIVAITTTVLCFLLQHHLERVQDDEISNKPAGSKASLLFAKLAASTLQVAFVWQLNLHNSKNSPQRIMFSTSSNILHRATPLSSSKEDNDWESLSLEIPATPCRTMQHFFNQHADHNVAKFKIHSLDNHDKGVMDELPVEEGL
jgi:hypothetical protein